MNPWLGVPLAALPGKALPGSALPQNPEKPDVAPPPGQTPAPNPTPPNPTPSAGGARPGGANPAPQNPAGPRPSGAVPVGPGQGGNTAAGTMRVEGDFYVFNFEDSSSTEGCKLIDFVRLCNENTGIAFYIKKEVLPKLDSAKVSIIGSRRIPKAKLYDFFQSILKINDMVLVSEGGSDTGMWVIADLKGSDRTGIKNSAKYIGPEEIPSYATQPGVLVTTVITIENTSAREVSASLRPFFPDNQLETVTNVGNANALLVTGFGPTVFSIWNLLKLIDTPPNEPRPIFEKIELVHAAAAEVQTILDDLLEKRRQVQGGQGVSGGQLQGQAPELKIRVDGNSNSLLVVGLEEDVKQVLEIVARIDQAQPEPESDLHVYTLQNVKAEDLVKILQEFLDKTFQNQQQVNQAAGAGRAGGGGGGGSSANREIRPVVVGEKVSNSVLVTASKTRWLEIRDIIERLDRRQRQVLLETALVELTTTDAIRLGIELGLVSVPPAGSDVSKGFGITNFGLSSLIDTDNDNFPDTRIPDNSLQGVTGGILSGPDFGIPILLQALRTISDSNVLSIPSVLVNNNEKAKVSSKDLIPTANTTNSPNVGTAVGFGGYQEAGITLEITPSISAQAYLRLDLSLQVANFTAAQGANINIPPPKTEREVKTTVYLPNESTMVIGGIQIDNALRSKSSIPLLGDIPILSWLFSNHSDSNTRRALYFFVTPHILSDVEFADLQNLSYQRKLDARSYIGDERLRMVDKRFQPIEPGAALESSIFEIPLYRSPKAGEVAPSDIGVKPEDILPAETGAAPAQPADAPPVDKSKG